MVAMLFEMVVLSVFLPNLHGCDPESRVNLLSYKPRTLD